MPVETIESIWGPPQAQRIPPAVFRFALVLDAGKCFSRLAQVEPEPELLKLCETSFGQRFRVIDGVG
ncbi:MAG: hypothetical protein KC776_19860 [Myxococcales bacterium]|nr:hypothetical protein [Myxococcales bacterium]MCB9576884.1 hypothetical protein [Polyangiaceae bacterium]